jgi:hypothetical protein
LQASYVVRWTGIEIGRVDTELRRDGERYHLAYLARTSGPLRLLWTLRSDGWAAGRLDGDIPRAEHFQGRSAWGDGESFWRVSFGPDGGVTRLASIRRRWRTASPSPTLSGSARSPEPGIAGDARGRRRRAAGGTQLRRRRAMRYAMTCESEPSPIQPAALVPPPATPSSARPRVRSWPTLEALEPATRDGAPTRPPARIWLVPGIGGLPHWPVRIEAERRFGRITIELDRLVDPGPV